MGTSTVEQPRVSDTGNDDDVIAHIVHTPGASASAMVTKAMVEGRELEALCGLRWIPSRDPERKRVCEDCVRVSKQME